MRLFLRKTPPENRQSNPKLPYFTLVLPPEQEGGQWIEIGAFWPAKSGNGYTGRTEDGVDIDITNIAPFSSKGSPEDATD